MALGISGDLACDAFNRFYDACLFQEKEVAVKTNAAIVYTPKLERSTKYCGYEGVIRSFRIEKRRNKECQNG